MGYPDYGAGGLVKLAIAGLVAMGVLLLLGVFLLARWLFF